MLEQERINKMYSCRTKITPGKVTYMDDTSHIYKDYFTFREENPSGRKKKGIPKKKNSM